MRALLLALLSTAAFAEPPITQEEAIAFHTSGRCQMMQPGSGITRSDGDGWVVSMVPGWHRFYVTGGPYSEGASMAPIDMTPGKPYPINVLPGGTLRWCPQFVAPGRDACGPVPPAFLYDAVRR